MHRTFCSVMGLSNSRNPSAKGLYLARGRASTLWDAEVWVGSNLVCTSAESLLWHSTSQCKSLLSRHVMARSRW